MTSSFSLPSFRIIKKKSGSYSHLAFSREHVPSVIPPDKIAGSLFIRTENDTVYSKINIFRCLRMWLYSNWTFFTLFFGKL